MRQVVINFPINRCGRIRLPKWYGVCFVLSFYSHPDTKNIIIATSRCLRRFTWTGRLWGICSFALLVGRLYDFNTQSSKTPLSRNQALIHENEGTINGMLFHSLEITTSFPMLNQSQPADQIPCGIDIRPWVTSHSVAGWVFILQWGRCLIE